MERSVKALNGGLCYNSRSRLAFPVHQGEIIISEEN